MKTSGSVSYLLNRDALYSGWLKKVSEGPFGKKSSKKRYAVIHDSALYLFQDDTSSSTTKIIPLAQYDIKEIVETINGVSKWGFSLHPKIGDKNSEVCQFNVGSEREMNDWLTNLKSCKHLKDDVVEDENKNSYIAAPVRRPSKDHLQVSDAQDALGSPGRRRSSAVLELVANLHLRNESPSPVRDRTATGGGDSKSLSLPSSRVMNNLGGRPEMPIPSHAMQREPQQQQQQQEQRNQKQGGLGGRPPMPLPPPRPAREANEFVPPNRFRSSSDNTVPGRKLSDLPPRTYEVSDNSEKDSRKISAPDRRLPDLPPRKPTQTDLDYYDDPDNPNADDLYTEQYMPTSFFKWGLDRDASNALLLECGTPGVYIMRKGKDKNDVLSAYLLGEVRHYKIFVENDEMFLQRSHPHFKRHLHMIMYYHENNLPTCHARLEAPYR